jgi:hypothetical protein
MAVQIVGFGGFPQEHLLQHVFELAGGARIVCGGNTANMLAVRRMHRFDEVLREAWEAGPDGEVPLPVRVIDDAAL